MNTKPLKPTDKRVVKDIVGRHPRIYDFHYRTVDEIIKDMEAFKREYPESLNLRFEYGCCYPYDETMYHHLVHDRPETDEELAKRLDQALQQEKREKEQLEYLKKKYEQ